MNKILLITLVAVAFVAIEAETGGVRYICKIIREYKILYNFL